MAIKTTEEIELIRESARLVSTTLALIASEIKPGVTTLQLDELADTFIKDNGATPSFYNYEGFPFHICASLNSAVVHGLPNNNPLKEGDVLSIDIGVYMNGYHGDHAYTFIIGEVTDDILQLVRVTKESLYKGVSRAIHGNRIGDISNAIQTHVEQYGYGVVRELVGHGLGKKMHEKPDVPNYGRKGSGVMLKENMVLAIEPMINMGSAKVFTGEDDWTIFTADNKMAVHFEHDICVKKGSAILLSDFSIIEAAEKKNAHLNSSYYS